MGLANLPDDLEFPSDVDEMKEILLQVEPKLRPIPDIRGHVSRFVDGADMDQVYPRLWLGDCDAAMNKSYLLHHKITHVLNAAGNKSGPAPVKTGHDFYKNTPIIYSELDLIDLPFANVSRYFEKAALFVKEALDADGVVLVHCRQGRSRSASVVAAFLMIHEEFTAGKAIRLLRERREIRPNNGFLQQLANLDLKLFRQRFEEYRNGRSDSESDSDSNSSRMLTCNSDSGNESEESCERSLDGQQDGPDSRRSSINSYSDSDCDSDDEESDSESGNSSDFSF